MRTPHPPFGQGRGARSRFKARELARPRLVIAPDASMVPEVERAADARKELARCLAIAQRHAGAIATPALLLALIGGLESVLGIAAVDPLLDRHPSARQPHRPR